ncbi:MAG TPA: SpoIIE family protein phosphatase [Clostridia bacterium]|nr:SpoIIE family protein phosphatase [Clostridia bacterium]HPK16170.1 SpoIIE family protein phosphatase [Clostridia bacterium]
MNRFDGFDYAFRFAGQKDIGRKRESNQDEAVLCPEIGFFAVSDGMGGLANGAMASAFVSKSMTELMTICAKEFQEHRSIELATEAFRETVRMMSDNLFDAGNTEKRITYGATFSGVWLLGNKAVFVNLGDSRGYLLSRYKKQPRQITEDQNIAGILVKQGELSREAAKDHPSSSRLTAFVGMKPPAEPEAFTVEIRPGDRILLCSDGLYGMVGERELARLMRASQNPKRVCHKLVDAANDNGGRDNISSVYIRIFS